ncbi:MAG TPA: hypothetical protein PLV68_08730, partial [Ilumatobacteraceae bacterium]|nr:hypothetical protein [Ilumatobacteraceae bacterium]
MTPPPVPQAPIPVSYADPPPTLPLRPLTYYPFTTMPDQPQIAIGDNGVVVLNEDGTRAATIDWDGGHSSTVTLDAPISQPVMGPDDVLYGLTNIGPGPADFGMVAIPLRGPR